MSDSPENTPKSAAPAAEEKAAPVIEAGPVCAALQAQGIALTPVLSYACGVETLATDPAQALRVAEALKAQGFDLLVSASGVDWKTHRDVVYHLYSLTSHQFIALKIRAGEDDKVPSMMPVWPAADWHERETYDLFGIHFEGHPRLERILMPVDWIGHPLRKDYVENDPRLVWNQR